MLKFVDLNGRSVISRSVATALGLSDGVVVVLPDDALWESQWDGCEGTIVVGLWLEEIDIVTRGSQNISDCRIACAGKGCIDNRH